VVQITIKMDSEIEILKTMLQNLESLNLHQSEDQLIIGLDFGTTFSGIAYGFSKGTNPEPVSILDWPGEFNGLRSNEILLPNLINYSRR
jgi:hypothetical protein